MRKRDLRKYIEEKNVEYLRAKRRLENEGDVEDKSPEPRNYTGSVQPTNTDMLNTIMELKRKLEGGGSMETDWCFS